MTLLLHPSGNKIMPLSFCEAYKKEFVLQSEARLFMQSAFNVLQLTEIRLLSKLPAKPLHSLSQGGLSLCVARSILLASHTWHGVHHAHLGSGGWRDKAWIILNTSGNLLFTCNLKVIFIVSLMLKSAVEQMRYYLVAILSSSSIQDTEVRHKHWVNMQCFELNVMRKLTCSQWQR